MGLKAKPGVIYALSAYTLWGLFPLYFYWLRSVPAFEVLAHRMVWTLLFLVLVLLFKRHLGWIKSVCSQPKTLAWFALSASLISVNWGLYIWAVEQQRVVDASLGYFITPLVNVLLGAALLKERLRPVQWVCVALASLGVIWLTWSAHALPWIGLTLAITFGAYGLLRKLASLGALEGLSLETALLFPLALAYLLFTWQTGTNTFVLASPSLQVLLATTGPVTALPLLLFAAGARRLPLSTMGLLQYISPSLQFFCGLWFFNEVFDTARLIGFCFIWLALIVFSVDSLWRSR
ncbi:MAG: EamA family transporter RarD [Burkholderiales bacterium]|jgi:chloramphenicol-sensitive protein RarD